MPHGLSFCKFYLVAPTFTSYYGDKGFVGGGGVCFLSLFLEIDNMKVTKLEMHRDTRTIFKGNKIKNQKSDRSK